MEAKASWDGQCTRVKVAFFTPRTREDTVVTFQKQNRMLALAFVLTALICVSSPARTSDDHNSKAKKAATQSAKLQKCSTPEFLKIC